MLATVSSRFGCWDWDFCNLSAGLGPVEAVLATVENLPRGSIVVLFWGSYIESYKVIPKRNYYGAFGYSDKMGIYQAQGLRDVIRWYRPLGGDLGGDFSSHRHDEPPFPPGPQSERNERQTTLNLNLTASATRNPKSLYP